jgi:hypothetical protein
MGVGLHDHYFFCSSVKITCRNSGVGLPATECGHRGRSGGGGHDVTASSRIRPTMGSGELGEAT